MASTPIAPAECDDNNQLSTLKSNNLQSRPILPTSAFANEFCNNNNSSSSNSNNNDNGGSRSNSDTQNITINQDHKSHENATNDVADINAEASFGSFSMEEEDMSKSVGSLGDATTYNFNETPAAVGRENTVPHPESIERVPQIVRAVGDQKNQTVMTKEEYPSRLSPVPPTKSETRSDSFREKNIGRFKQHESDPQSIGSIKNDPEAEQAVTKIQPMNDSGTETRDTRIPQPQDHKQQYQQQRKTSDEVIDLIDDDIEIVAKPSKNTQMTSLPSGTSGFKRSRPTEINGHRQSTEVVPGSSLRGYQSYNQHQAQRNEKRFQSSRGQAMNIVRRPDISSDPLYITIPPNHTPTWDHPLPPPIQQPRSYANQYKHFELSLLNVSEFTITGLPVTFDGRPSSVLGFRKIVKEVSRGHGKAVFERDIPTQSNKNDTLDSSGQNSDFGTHENPDGGKWRIPLGAYRSFYSYLKSDTMCRVKGIPEDQLKIASLGKARLEKGFPSAEKILAYGVPNGLATALAPFQRGGVDFVVEKKGRALIADDMGLGKTIQSIASMSVYHEEWPLLILTPSSARYHWAAEFNNWLGLGSSININEDTTPTASKSTSNDDRHGNCEDEDANILKYKKSMRLLKESEIHVILAGKEKIFPSKETRIVICSYGLATSLVESGKLHAGLFRCAIVDESHMLKNIKTKRTNLLVPILHATTRCILLSGTPALARPTELWPQLKILSTERDGWWDDEDEFLKKYVQRTSAIRRAELHTMLTGTVMIRRMKHDILKSLPSKQREKAIVDVMTPSMRQDFGNCMKLLRKGKGVMAKIAKRHSVVNKKHEINNLEDQTRKKLESLKAEYNERCNQKLQSIRFAMQSAQMDDGEKTNLMKTCFSEAKAELDVWYKERVNELGGNNLESKKEEELDPKTILNKMYSMTAKAKIPLIAEMVGKWLEDPTKGKLCVFAHHINVLDEISKLVGLSNLQGSRKRFIRIDGSTSPKERQAQIVAFQNDPDIRIAVLGITAAGVAVTLTASSTVWFAELFWTPALMIQAEDRCHRIGQNAKVKCLYFVATGTLDVLLWDLLEKKFRDLGEFVEGKEKMKILVHNIFKSAKELRSTFLKPGDDILDDDLKQNEDDPVAEGNDLIKLESDLKEDIVQLAHEEMVMISQVENEDGTDNRVVGKLALQQNPVHSKPGLGQTEDEAICLSDDEDDDIAQHNGSANTNHDTKAEPSRLADDPSVYFSKSRVLHQCRFYKQYFEGSSYGIQLLYVCHRLAVANNRFGKLKPAFGDVLVAVNNYRLPFGCPMEHVCRCMKTLIAGGTVELTFIEDEEFVKHCAPTILDMRRCAEADGYQGINKKPKNAQTTNSDDVIEILDD
mmetsp:Transcript_22808/g.54032  ORF Transcript_22808/g.54032 Transcript_22808/m.54032 type:complete len:1364 (-) Transcript_22808:143-4234(-)